MTADDRPMAAPLPPQLASAGLRIDRQLQRRRMSFDEDAGLALADAHADFLADLGVEAARLARKDRLNTVHRVHVEKAVDRLGAGSGASGFATVCNTLGGVVAGIGVAGAYNLAFNPAQHTTAEQMVTIALCIVGFVMLTVGVSITMIRSH